VRDFGMIALEHLVLFDNADRDIQPILRDSLPWDSIKQFFLQQADQLEKKWFECTKKQFSKIRKLLFLFI
jgi:hypothetical protein